MLGCSLWRKIALLPRTKDKNFRSNWGFTACIRTEEWCLNGVLTFVEPSIASEGTKCQTGNGGLLSPRSKRKTGLLTGGDWWLNHCIIEGTRGDQSREVSKGRDVLLWWAWMEAAGIYWSYAGRLDLLGSQRRKENVIFLWELSPLAWFFGVPWRRAFYCKKIK